MRLALSGCAAVLLLVAGCQQHPPRKMSPDELNSMLQEKGLSVKKAGAFTNEYPREMNMKLTVNGVEGFVAARFSDTDLARDYCQTREACASIMQWAIEPPYGHEKSPTWQTVSQLAH